MLRDRVTSLWSERKQQSREPSCYPLPRHGELSLLAVLLPNWYPSVLLLGLVLSLGVIWGCPQPELRQYALLRSSGFAER